jgi:uncharacterized phiE125 gp8 family phage protein
MLRPSALDLRLKTAPAEPPVGLDEVKAHLRVDFEDDDDLIEGLIDAATAHLDGFAGILGRAMVTQTWTLGLDATPPALAWSRDWFVFGRGRPNAVRLPLPPLIEVDEFRYTDADGVEQILDPDLYRILEGPLSQIEPAFGLTWPATRLQRRAAEIDFVCGYGAAAAVPRPSRPPSS